MNSEANYKNKGRTTKIHTCERHHDLSILLKTANKKICNTCFSTLKNSHYNVLAGCLLELHYLHNVTRGLLEQNNMTLRQLKEQEIAILNLQSEITEIKNNGKEHLPPRTEKASKTPSEDTQSTCETVPNQAPIQQQRETPDAQEICTEGHLAQVAHTLGNLLHVKIERILDTWKQKKLTTTPKSDDLRPSKGTTHTHGGFSMQ